MTSPIAPLIVHGTSLALAVDPDGPTIGIMLQGPPGCGKTAATLRLIEDCPYGRTELVADDQTQLTLDQESVIARAPQIIAGQAEVRGGGLIRLRSRSHVALSYIFKMTDGARIIPPEKFAPFGNQAESVTVISLQHFDAIRSLVRSLLAGHSLTGDVD